MKKFIKKCIKKNSSNYYVFLSTGDKNSILGKESLVVKFSKLHNRFHVFVYGKLILAMDVVKPTDVTIPNVSSFVFTYAFCLEPKLYACGLIKRNGIDSSELN